MRNKILYVCAMNKFVFRMPVWWPDHFTFQWSHVRKIPRHEKSHFYKWIAIISRLRFSTSNINVLRGTAFTRRWCTGLGRGIRLERDDFHRDGFHTYPSSRHSGATFVPRCTVSGAGCSPHRIPLMCLCIWPTHGPVVDTGVCAFWFV